MVWMFEGSRIKPHTDPSFSLTPVFPLIDCRASYEVSVFEEVALQHSKRVFQQNTAKADVFL